MNKILAPTNCPSCDSDLELVNDQLFCRFSKCPAKVGKQLEHFCKTMKIKGMGPKTIEKLKIVSIPELYEMSPKFLVDTLGDKIGSKLLVEIRASQEKDLSIFLAAFSIPLIGNTAASKIGNVVSNISDINPENAKAAGLGEKAAENLLSWILKSWFTELVNIPVIQLSTRTTNIEQRNLDVNVVITGKLNNFKNRAEAKTHLESLGFTVKSSVTKAVNYLIDEEGRQSSSRTKAESFGIEITTIEKLTNKEF